MAAFAAVQSSLLKDLLNADTPEAREQKFHQWKGVEHVLNTLKNWAGDEVYRRNQENEE